MKMDSKKEKELAREFEVRREASKDLEIPLAPPGEFEKILEEMERRGIKPKLRKELEK
jgi:hypothetical protein